MRKIWVHCGTVLKHGVAGLKQRMYGSFQQAILANCLAHRRLECCAPVGQPDSFLAEQAADRVLEGDQLRLQGCASRQQPALSLRLRRFDPDRPVLVDAHQIGDAASIVAIVLVAKTGLQRRGRVPRIDADHRPAIPPQPGKQPSGGTTRLQADPLDGKPGGVDKVCDNLGIGRQLGLSHDFAFAVQDAKRALLGRNINADVVHGGSSGLMRRCTVAP